MACSPFNYWMEILTESFHNIFIWNSKPNVSLFLQRIIHRANSSEQCGTPLLWKEKLKILSRLKRWLTLANIMLLLIIFKVTIDVDKIFERDRLKRISLFQAKLALKIWKLYFWHFLTSRWMSFCMVQSYEPQVTNIRVAWNWLLDFLNE